MSTPPLSRRSLLKAAGAAALASSFAAPLFIPSTSLASSAKRRRGPGDKIGLALIGMGIQNRFHLSAFLKNDAVRVLAVCDVDTTRRLDAKSRVDAHYGSDPSAGCGEYECFRELLPRPDIDAVVISTPDHWHAIQVIESAAAGKDIYCEKPLCHTILEARAIIAAVRKHGRILQTGSQQRTEHGGRFRQAVELIRAGRLGTLLTVHVGVGTSSIPCDLPEEPPEPGLNWDRWLGPAPLRPYNSILSPRGVNSHYPDWRLYREYSGGMMTDWGAHHFDIVQWALDADASGPTQIIPPRDETATHGARLIYPTGVEVYHGGPPYGIVFSGTRGTLFLSRERLEAEPKKILNDPLTDAEPRIPTVSTDHRQNWLDCIRTRSQPICHEEIGARSVTVCHLANLAYWHRRPLKWDPQTWTFPGDAEASTWLDYQRREGYQLPKVE